MAKGNPALGRFLESFASETLLGQVLIRKSNPGFSLCHHEDRGVAPLREISVLEVNKIGQFTAEGAFRPLKSTPDLIRGWLAHLKTEEELEQALSRLYPGAVADWEAKRSNSAQPTGYRAFTERQSGMYRITTMLTDLEVGALIDASCSPAHCLKQRLWSIGPVMPDSEEAKSIIPCFEPCAIFLELARKSVRINQRSTHG